MKTIYFDFIAVVKKINLKKKNILLQGNFFFYPYMSRLISFAIFRGKFHSRMSIYFRSSLK